MNPGKRFEQKFRESVPDGTFIMRIADKVYTINGRTYSEESEADFLAANSEGAYLIECKATQETRLPYSKVLPHQEEALAKFDALGDHTHGLLAVEFYDKGGYRGPKCMFLLPISRWFEFKRVVPSRSSMPMSAFEKLGRRIEYAKGRYLL